MMQSFHKELCEKIWSIDPSDDHKGTWWWWFWLFFIDNPKNPEKPHQMMILWSTKNEKQIVCNNQIFKFPRKINLEENKATFDGVVAAWYYDGEMHHNYLLEETDIKLTKKPYALIADSKNKTSFYEKDGVLKVLINKDKTKFEFDLKVSNGNFPPYTFGKEKYPFGLSYSALGIPKANLTGSITTPENKEKIKGSAYFQYVVVNAPSPSWYWGLFHFPKGSILSYFNPHIGPAILKGNLTEQFFEKGNIHLGDDLYFMNKKSGKREAFKVTSVKNKKNKENLPLFEITASNSKNKISFDVDCYAESYWEFEKKSLGFLKTKLRYNEYPAKIKNFKLKNSKGKEILSSKDVGEAVGNAEHSWGILL